MAVLALALCVLYAVALFGFAEVALRRGGAGCWARTANPVERLANGLVLAGWLLDLLGPALVLGGAVEPPGRGPALHAAGALVAVGSLVLGIAAQRAMGAAWRTSIDPRHPAPLVDAGLFAVVRNPVYTTMVGISVGAFALVPTAPGALGIALVVVGVEVQARLVEEPYLRARHGEPYERYVARVGRFVPGVGRVQKPSR